MLLFASFILHLDHVHRSVVRSRLANQTYVNAEIPRCGIPYDKLCCFVLQSADAGILKQCIPYPLLLLSRIAVPVFMAMIAFILQLGFRIDGKHSRLVVRTLWTIYALVFVIITYRVHYDSCFHRHTVIFLIVPGGLPYLIVAMLIPEGTGRPFALYRNDNNSDHAPIEVDDESTEAVDDRPIVWTKIL
ncbi:unnamed protein product [Adineta ricciae]|uniref:Uncharacterized protein n=1 Tax=Adineta ricciae TaxID=249248 RepID=A0A814ZVX0_ADIRI|nr:unnamed protein product [Adineta ricciae]CAF1472159.1 unnamed protein product [Adineta ricciae]